MQQNQETYMKPAFWRADPERQRFAYMTLICVGQLIKSLVEWRDLQMPNNYTLQLIKWYTMWEETRYLYFGLRDEFCHNPVRCFNDPENVTTYKHRLPLLDVIERCLEELPILVSKLESLIP